MERGENVKIFPKASFNKYYSAQLRDLCYSMLEYNSSMRISSIEALFNPYFEKEIKDHLLKVSPKNESYYFVRLYERFGTMKTSDLISEIKQIISRNKNDASNFKKNINDSNNIDYIKGLIAIDYLRIFYLEEQDKIIDNEKNFNQFELIFEYGKEFKLELAYLCLACEVEIFRGNYYNANKIRSELLANMRDSMGTNPENLEKLLIFRTHLYYQYKAEPSIINLQYSIKDYIRNNNFWNIIYSKLGKYAEVARTMNLIGLVLKKCQIYGKLTLNSFKLSQQIFAKLQGYTHNLEAKTFLNLFEIYFDRANFRKALINLKLAYDYLNCFKSVEHINNSKINYVIIRINFMANLLTLYILTVNDNLCLEPELYDKKYTPSFFEEFRNLKYIDQIDMKNRKAFLYANSMKVSQAKNEFNALWMQIYKESQIKNDKIR